MLDHLSLPLLRCRARKHRPVINEPPPREVGARWTGPLQRPEDGAAPGGLWNRAAILYLLLTILFGISVGVPLGLYLHRVL